MAENINKGPGPGEDKEAERPVVRVKDVMEKVFVSVTPDISSADLMYRSSKPHIPRLPFIGTKIYTSRVGKYAKEFKNLLDQPCEKLMTKNVMIATPKADVEQVAAVMILEHLKVLPVVDNKRVVGMITRACILKDLYREWKY